MRNRIVRLARVRASALLPDDGNWRTHDADQRRAIRAALREVGIAGALIARETPEGLRLIDGHARVDELGDAEVPVLVLDVDEREAKALAATLDPIAEMAESDHGVLRELTEGLAFDEPDLVELVAEMTGGDAADTPEPDDEDEAEPEPVIRIDRKKIPSTADEVHRLWVAHEWFVSRHGTSDGFVTWLLDQELK